MPTPAIAVKGTATRGDVRNLCACARPRIRPASMGPCTEAYANTRPDQPCANDRSTSAHSRRGKGRLLASGVVPDLFDESLVALDAELDDDVESQVQQILDVGPCEIPGAVVLLYQQHQLFERQLRAGR